ncbi:MAG: phosphatase PAP2 family protein [Acidimicrobiales bacterium]|nr:phosphatase PAP2 family protein [Acidimicrobiales bacterium]
MSDGRPPSHRCVETAASRVGNAEVAAPGWVQRLDDSVDRWWDDNLRGRPALDRAYYLASELGDFSLVWQLVAAAQGLRSDPRDQEAALRLGVALLAESILVNQGIKRLFRRSRPAADFVRPHNLRAPKTSSFPSGHASAAFTAAGILSARDPRWRPAIYAAAVFVATSRVHVRIHHASDVVAGAALGAVFAKVADRVWPMPPRN